MKSAISYIFTFTSDRLQISTYPSGRYQVCCVCAKFGVLGCEIWLPMFCSVSMRDPWHSYLGSTSVLPEYGGGSDSPAITVPPRPPLLECRGCGQSNAREWKIAATA